jgi:lactoylglutathione lyase
MELGAFSVSLNVTDIQASKAFYEKLGFDVAGGDAEQGWLIIRNGACTIGLFQDMLEKNTLTFNPGWDQQASPLASFQDIRDLQKALKSDGVEFVSEADEQSEGPASFILMDPDGNPVLIDQHV